MNACFSRWFDRARVSGRLLACAVSCSLAIGLFSNTCIGAVASDSPPEASGSTFNIFEFRILGNSTLPARRVEEVVYPFLGEGRTLGTVELARDALVGAYRAAGLGTVLVDIPEQTVDDGVVRLQVTEGRIESVRVAGAKYYSGRRLVAHLPSAVPGSVPVLPALQSELATLGSEARDRQITPVLKPGLTPGSVELDLEVQDRLPVHATLEVNNRYTADTAHLRSSASVSYENMFQRAEVMSVQVQTTPTDTSQVKVGVLNYMGRTSSPDWTWSAYAIRSNSQVAAIGTLNVIGNGTIVGWRVNDTFVATEHGSQTLTFGGDFKDFQQDVNLPKDISAKTPIRYALWTGQYAVNTSSSKFDSQSNLSMSLGARGVVNDEAQFAFSRYGAHAGFAVLRGASSLTWRLLRDWSLNARTSFQYSEQPLISNEQFSLGGVDTVRGFLDAEALVDSGVAAGLELRAPLLRWGALQAGPFVFYDRGFGMVQDPLSQQIKGGTVRDDLVGVGAGMRIKISQSLDALLDFSRPKVTASRTQVGDTRIDFSVRLSY